MRHPLAFLCVCAVGVMPLVGCDDFLQPESCDGVVCDDGNECTMEFCRCDGLFCTAECVTNPVVNGTDCTFDGVAGVCVAGVCGENLCLDVVCEDDDPCTDDICDYVDGTCDFPPTVCDDGDDCTEDTCDPVDGCTFTPDEDKEGTNCAGPGFAEGTCEAGVCVPWCDPASEEEYECPVYEGLVCCPGWKDCLDSCPPCDPASEEEYECPVNEGLLCCPGSEYCFDSCPLE
jgi:hypothetical protein